MKLYATTLAGLLLSSTAAMAGSLADPVVEPVVDFAAPAASQWEGAYVGATAGTTTAEWTYDPESVTVLSGQPMTYGAFAGYNHVLDSGLMIGAEAAYTMGSFDNDPEGAVNVSFLDLKARAGFAAGNALIYGFGGYTMASQDFLGSESFSGWNAGAGVDFLVTDSIFVGGEYTLRNTTMDSDPDYSLTANTLGLRVGMKF